MMWFTADTHFGHEAIIRMTHRPFDSVELMNAALIANINACVGPADTLYVLGDFAYRCSADAAFRLRERIVCRKIRLIRGNHDIDWAAQSGPAGTAFASERDYEEVKPGFAHGHKLVLFHYPMLSWNGKWRAAIHLHGHIHSEGPSYNERNRARGVLRYDVGVDANGYRPVSLNEILDFFQGVEPVPADSDPEDRAFERAGD